MEWSHLNDKIMTSTYKYIIYTDTLTSMFRKNYVITWSRNGLLLIEPQAVAWTNGDQKPMIP